VPREEAGVTDTMHGVLKYIEDVAPVIFVIGLYGLLRVMLTWRNGTRTAQWPTVEGVVTSVGTEKTRKAASNIGRGNAPKVTFYKPHIAYSYQIGGQRFIGNRLQYGMAKRLRVKTVAQQAIGVYSVHQTVCVYYNPTKPNDSVLQIGPHPCLKKGLLVMVGIMVVACGSWILARILH
jgi:hypothetical protein